MHKNLLLSVASGLVSIANFVGAHFTKSDIAWYIGVTAGLYSIYCSYLTHMEKRRNAMKHKQLFTDKYKGSKN